MKNYPLTEPIRTENSVRLQTRKKKIKGCILQMAGVGIFFCKITINETHTLRQIQNESP